jgi:hypothetical protein
LFSLCGNIFLTWQLALMSPLGYKYKDERRLVCHPFANCPTFNTRLATQPPLTSDFLGIFLNCWAEKIFFPTVVINFLCLLSIKDFLIFFQFFGDFPKLLGRKMFFFPWLSSTFLDYWASKIFQIFFSNFLGIFHIF